jgi:hypothetical protein
VLVREKALQVFNFAADTTVRLEAELDPVIGDDLNLIGRKSGWGRLRVRA